MSAAPMAKLMTAKLDELRPRIEAPPEADGLLAACQSAPEALEALVSGGYMNEAMRLLAHGLPRREGVWWVCMCARHTAPADLAAADMAALEAAELWVRRPSDENRRAAFARAEEARFGTPEAWACVAAFWSTGSMAPVGQPEVPAAPHLAGTAIAGAVSLAAVRGNPARQPERLGRFLESARDISAGGTGRLAAEAQ
jgi:hypothetical protein